ncbi:hypothetical protein [Rummeliibacillus sp. SL167]|uniref:hypothetical protein n=1 Tax=Rummeliibacillus sp. SL167 TaxID=2579792 RepID=UPI0011B58ADA|nr:hypothetical protein [Rummeliibacillus sp. SL167]
MKFNYTLNSIKINSAWFDQSDRKQNVYEKITYKGLNLYFKLYKFRIHNQENEHTFITSISMLRKVTKYKTDEIFELLKKMKNAKIIKLENVSRWEYLIDENGNIKDKDILIITAIDTFPIEDFKKDDNKYYIFVPLSLFQLYEDKGLNEKYYALYCLIVKWSQNQEHKSWMSIAKMAKFLGFDKDYVNQMIYNMNRYYFMSSYRKRNGKGGFNFEHFILNSWKPDEIEKFIRIHKENMDKLISRVDNKKKNKKKMDIETELEIVEEQPKQIKQQKAPTAFGKPRKDVTVKKVESTNDNEILEQLNVTDRDWEEIFG